MTEKQKERAEIKKEFQELISEIRKKAGFKAYPKAVFTVRGMKAENMRAVIRCGETAVESVQKAVYVRKDKDFLKYLKANNAGAGFSVEKKTSESGRKDGKPKQMARRIIVVTWYEEQRPEEQADETEE